MKLCIVTPNVIKGDGQGRANYEITWEALRRGHEVILLAHQVDHELQQHPRVQWVSFRAYNLPTQILKEIQFAWQSALWLRQHRHELDVLHVDGAVTLFPSDSNTAHFIHTTWLRSPSHIIHQRRDLYGLYQWLYTALNSIWEKQAFHQTTRMIAVSQRIRDELLAIGIPSDRIQVILNGVDPQEFFPAWVDRHPLGLPNSVPLALFAGDIRLNRKNLDTVLQALAQVPTVHLVVAGTLDSPFYPQMATQLGVADRVHFLGFRHDLPTLMQAANLFIFPSRYEPFGMVITEAMATGLPVITAATTGASELVTAECGLVIANSDDHKALADALRYLVDHPEQCLEMGQAGRTIAQHHNWQSKASHYVDLFETLQVQHHKHNQPEHYLV